MNACGADTYCCAGDEKQGSCNCTSKNNVIPIQPGVVQTVIGLSAPVSTQTPIFSTVTTTSATTTKSATNSTSTATQSSKKESVTSKTALKAGLGGGLGGLALIAFVGIIFYFISRNRKSSSPATHDQMDYSAEPYITPAELPYQNAPTQPMATNPNGTRSNAAPLGRSRFGRSSGTTGNGFDTERSMSPTNPFDDPSRTPTPGNRLRNDNDSYN